MTNITGYVVDIVSTPTHISSTGYYFLSGATVTVGLVSDTTSGNGYFNVVGVDTTISTVVVTYPRYETTEVATTSSAIVAVWKCHGYT